MSIKFKLPLTMFVFFILFTFSLTLYYHFFAKPSVKHQMDVYRDELDQASEEISQEIRDTYPDKQKIIETIQNSMRDEKMKVSLFETNGTPVYSSNNTDHLQIALWKKSYIEINGQTAYILEISYPYTLKNILGINAQSGIVLFSVILLFIIVLLLILYLQHYIINPLARLQKKFDSVKSYQNTTDPPVKRKDEIGAIYKKFDSMVQDLEEAHLQQVDMIASISHDLKTPLTSIMGYVERLTVANLNEEKKQEYYSIIYNKAQDIENLIREFSDYAKNELSMTKLRFEKIPAKDFISSLYMEYSEELTAYHVDFELVCDITENHWLQIDVGKIRRVFANLISNSLKYAEEPVKIKMLCIPKKEGISFSIEDNGRGVPAEELTRIFNNFYRVDKSRSREKGGSGLGLAICKSIVESHGGKIHAYNIPEGGFGITFLLPYL